MPEAEHKKYGGSTMERTELCPGSVKAISDLPVRPGAGPAAERGTRIHKLVETLLAEPVDDTINRLETAETASEEERIAVIVAHNILSIASEHGFLPSALLIEQPVELDHIHPEAGGTADVIAYKAFGDLLIIDTKTGRRFVSAEDNLQLAFYALGALQGLDEFTRFTIENVHFVIVQPEQEAPYDCAIRKWTISKADLLANYEPRCRSIIERAEANPELRTPGDHCEGKYCDARHTCQAYKTWLAEKSQGAFLALLQGESDEIPQPQTDADLARALEAVPYIRAWCKHVEEMATKTLMGNPKAVPGWALVDSFGNRKWSDPEAAERALRGGKIKLKLDELKPRSLLSPAQAEKLLKAQKKDTSVIESLTTRPYNGVKLKQCDEAQDPFADLWAQQQTQQTNFEPPAASGQ